LLPLLRYLEYEGRTAPALKFMLDRMGLTGGQSASPKLPLLPDEERKIEAIMDALEIGLVDEDGGRGISSIPNQKRTGGQRRS
jgi:dihydrodipicolinate synthase/N-acetylneuraminate lyase